MNPFLLSPMDRLEHWKNFRKTIIKLPEINQMEAVGDYWSNAPLKNIAYDPDDPTSWPTIWEMIRNGEWCRNSIAIGMEATLRLIGFEPNRLMLGTIIDQDISAMLMIVRIDEDKVLNYDWRTLSAYPHTKHYWIRKYRWVIKRYRELD